MLASKMSAQNESIFFSLLLSLDTFFYVYFPHLLFTFTPRSSEPRRKQNYRKMTSDNNKSMADFKRGKMAREWVENVICTDEKRTRDIIYAL